MAVPAELRLRELVAQLLDNGTPRRLLEGTVTEAVQHARRKASLLRRVDSSLYVTALEQIEKGLTNLPSSTYEYPSNPDEDEAQEDAAGEVLAPLLSFAAEVQEQGAQREGPTLPLPNSRLAHRREDSAFLAGGALYDFDRAESLKASYYLTEEEMKNNRSLSSGLWSDPSTDYTMSTVASDVTPTSLHQQRGAGGEANRGALRAVDAAAASASDDSWGSLYGSEQAFCDLSTITPPAHIMRKLALSIKRMSL
ncbi:hypothetical protein N2152v2_010275 [Parachlorella kessleri]